MWDNVYYVQHATRDMHSADRLTRLTQHSAADALFPICAFFLFLTFLTNYVVTLNPRVNGDTREETMYE